MTLILAVAPRLCKHFGTGRRTRPRELRARPNGSERCRSSPCAAAVHRAVAVHRRTLFPAAPLLTTLFPAPPLFRKAANLQKAEGLRPSEARTPTLPLFLLRCRSSSYAAALLPAPPLFIARRSSTCAAAFHRALTELELPRRSFPLRRRSLQQAHSFSLWRRSSLRF